MWISSRSRPLDSRNRCQSLRIADRAPPFLILLLITSGVPRSRLPFPGDITHLLEQVGLFYSRPAGETSPAERRRDEPLPPRGSGGKGNEIPRNHYPSRIPDQVGRKCSKGAKLVTRPLDSANNVVKTNNEPVKLFELTTESLVKRAIKIALSRDLIVGSALRAPLWIVVTLTHVKTRQQYPYIYIYNIYVHVEFVPYLIR